MALDERYIPKGADQGVTLTGSEDCSSVSGHLFCMLMLSRVIPSSPTKGS